ncbi:MAG: DNA-3-methyladenine glycosylase [Alphaproteobacteria bacterium]|nr:DNA-3-methyladenine glycosylase [Alphaproteobacteria bacterium]
MTGLGVDGKIRCFGGQVGKEFYAHYHDHEWGVPLHDDQRLFEMLVLEGAQAGLSWETVLKKRDGYRQAFHDFDPHKVARMTDENLEALRDNPDIIRNRLKIYAARRNAHVFLDIQKEQGTFDAYLWGFVEGKPVINGMTFVGSTIMYAFMQATGMVNDHMVTCWRYGG